MFSISNLHKTNKLGLIVAVFIFFSGFLAIEHKLQSFNKQHNEANCSVCVIAKSFGHGQTSLEFELLKPTFELVNVVFSYFQYYLFKNTFSFQSRAPPFIA